MRRTDKEKMSFLCRSVCQYWIPHRMQIRKSAWWCSKTQQEDVMEKRICYDLQLSSQVHTILYSRTWTQYTSHACRYRWNASLSTWTDPTRIPFCNWFLYSMAPHYTLDITKLSKEYPHVTVHSQILSPLSFPKQKQVSHGSTSESANRFS